MTINMGTEDFVLQWGDGGNYVSYNLDLAQNIGIMEAIMLSKLIQQYKYWKKQGKLNKYGEFYMTAPDLEEVTAIPTRNQQRYITSLKNRGCLDTKPRLLPSKRHFKLHFEAIAKVMAEKPPQPQPPETDKEAPPKGGQIVHADSGAVYEGENDEKARFNQVGQIVHPRGDILSNQGATNCPSYIKEKNLKEIDLKNIVVVADVDKPHVNYLIENGISMKRANDFMQLVHERGLKDFQSGELLDALLLADDDDSIKHKTSNATVNILESNLNKRKNAARLAQLQAERKEENVLPFTKQPRKQAAGGRGGRQEKLPAWFTEKETKPEPIDPDFEEEKRKLEEALKERTEKPQE